MFAEALHFACSEPGFRENELLAIPSVSPFDHLRLKHFSTLAMKRNLTIDTKVWFASIPCDSGSVAVVVGFALFVEGDARIAKYAFLDSVGELAFLTM